MKQCLCSFVSSTLFVFVFSWLVLSLCKGKKVESVSKLFLIENRFHVSLRILSPEIYKQYLRVENWEPKATAEEAINSRLKGINQNVNCSKPNPEDTSFPNTRSYWNWKTIWRQLCRTKQMTTLTVDLSHTYDSKTTVVPKRSHEYIRKMAEEL